MTAPRRTPAWLRHGGLVAVATAAAALYTWHLERQGWGNAYYAAAAQSGASSWHALLFGAVDAGGALATDKPPLALWLMSASVRVFGLTGVALALPQVVAAVAATVLLARLVTHCAGRSAGMVAAATFAVTPVVGVLARFDDPDMLLVLLLVTAAYATVRWVQTPAAAWPLLAGAAMGAAFLTKWLAGFLVAPALAALVAYGAWSLRRERRLRWWLGTAGAATGTAVAVGGWWVVLVALTPAGSRPHLDGSASNSVVDLVLGRNGFARLGAHGPPSPTRSAISGTPGLARLVSGPFAVQISWFLPVAALVLLVLLVLLALLRRPGRRGSAGARLGLPPAPDLRVGGYLLWGTWLTVTGLVFSLMNGPMHPYYTVLLAPACAALVGQGVGDLAHLAGRGRRPALARALPAAGVVLVAAWHAWLVTRHQVGVTGLAWAVAAAGLGAAVLLAGGSRRRTVTATTAALLAVALLAAPLGASLATDQRVVAGADPLAGPGPSASAWLEPGLTAFLRRHQGTATWAAAAVDATPAALLQLQTGRPVMALGGFLGSVPAPTQGEFKGWVRAGRVRYLVLTGPYWRRSGAAADALAGSQASAIVAWAVAVGQPVSFPGDPTVVLDLAGWVGNMPCRGRAYAA